MAENTQVVQQAKGQVAEKQVRFSDALRTSLDDISEALPSGFNKVRFVQEAVAVMNEKKELSDYVKQYGTSQVKLGFLKAAYLGLSFQNKECYLIPYGSQLNFMTDFRGNIKLAKKYSTRKIKEIYAKVVKTGDELDISVVDGQQKVTFKPLPLNDGDIIGVFAVCEFKDGGILVETMTKKEIEKVRSKSRAGNRGPWVDFYGEMAKKSVLHRLCKMIDIDYETVYQQSVIAEENEIDEKGDAEIKDISEDIVDIEEVVIENAAE